MITGVIIADIDKVYMKRYFFYIQYPGYFSETKIFFPVLQKRNLRHIEVKFLVQGHSINGTESEFKLKKSGSRDQTLQYQIY